MFFHEQYDIILISLLFVFFATELFELNIIFFCPQPLKRVL